MNTIKLVAILIIGIVLVLFYFLRLHPTCEGPKENIVTSDPIEVDGERYCAFGVKIGSGLSFIAPMQMIKCGESELVCGNKITCICGDQ